MKKLSLLALLFITAFTLKAQTADEIVEKYLTAIGGADNWKKLESMQQIGTAAAQGMNIPFTMSAMRPNLSKVELEIQGMKMVQECYDGAVGWSFNPFGGGNTATKMTDEEAQEAAKNSFEDDFIDYKTKGHTIELQGTEEIEGSKCFKISMKRKVGDEKIYYFDTETYVPVMFRFFSATGPMKGMAIETYMSDYKELNGLMVPYSTEVKIQGQSAAVMKAEKIELNAKLDKKIFEFPK
jgi:outer membrane lipoprotein-sorting protein